MSDFFRMRTNTAALFINRQIYQAEKGLRQAQERLSSGLRINSAADDAAGLAISERLRVASRGLSQAEKNAQDGISLLQTAEGGLASISQQLQRIRELAIQAANDSLTNSDRELIQKEIGELVDEIDRTSSSIQYNNRQLLKNDFGTVDYGGKASTGKASLVFHIGSNRGETLKITTNNISTTTSTSLGIRIGGEKINITSQQLAESAIEIATRAINSISARRARVGAVQNRLEGAIEFLQIQNENTMAAESRIRDADIAAESVKYTKNMILLQAGTAMLAQAISTQNQILLQLLNSGVI